VQQRGALQSESTPIPAAAKRHPLAIEGIPALAGLGQEIHPRSLSPAFDKPGAASYNDTMCDTKEPNSSDYWTALGSLSGGSRGAPNSLGWLEWNGQSTACGLGDW
jgi:hypothetical protein